jgi:D-methionine transport system permease protein
MNFLSNLFPDVAVRMDEFYDCTVETLVMVGIVGIVSFVLSLLFAVILTTTKPGGLSENAAVYQFFDKLINLFRSIPFIILATTMIPFTRIVMGTAIGLKGAIFPLIVGITPFFSRQMESALLGVDPGLVEAAVSMGLSKPQIVWRVYLRESIAQIAKVTSITIVNLLSMTAVIGVVGGGGLGDFAIRYGFQRYMIDASIAVVLVYLVFIYIAETAGKLVIANTSH